MPIDFPNFYNNDEGHRETMYGNRGLKEKYLRDQALANRGASGNELAAQLAHRQQQAAMQGINRGIRGGGLNPFQRKAAEDNLQKIASRGNEAIGGLPRERQLAQNLHPDLNDGGAVVNAPYRMYSGKKVLGNIQGAFEHDQAVAAQKNKELLERLEQERQQAHQPNFYLVPARQMPR